jgi:ATP-dependent Clp protease, protease subunit
MNEEDGSTMSMKPYVVRPIAHMSRFYLSGEIESPENYISWFEQIRSAEENDVVILHINSPGGSLATTLQFLRVLEECRGTTVACVEGMCMSAATMIFLSCKHKEISRFSQFMFHNYSTEWSGKGGSIYSGMNHMHKAFESMIRKLYDGVLTDEELTQLMEDRDVWLDSEEMTRRLTPKEEKPIPVTKKATKVQKKTTTRRR